MKKKDRRTKDRRTKEERRKKKEERREERQYGNTIELFISLERERVNK